MTNEELKKKIESIIRNAKRDFAYCVPEEWAVKVLADALIAAGIGDVKETKHRAEIMELALDKMAEFVYETSAEQEMWKKEFIKQAETELTEERKDD